MILIGIENSFGFILFECCPIGVREDLDHSVLRHIASCSKSRRHLLGGI